VDSSITADQSNGIKTRETIDAR